jgi:hypothetical protein
VVNTYYQMVHILQSTPSAKLSACNTDYTLLKKLFLTDNLDSFEYTDE